MEAATAGVELLISSSPLDPKDTSIVSPISVSAAMHTGALGTVPGADETNTDRQASLSRSPNAQESPSNDLFHKSDKGSSDTGVSDDAFVVASSDRSSNVQELTSEGTAVASSQSKLHASAPAFAPAPATLDDQLAADFAKMTFMTPASPSVNVATAGMAAPPASRLWPPPVMEPMHASLWADAHVLLPPGMIDGIGPDSPLPWDNVVADFPPHFQGPPDFQGQASSLSAHHSAASVHSSVAPTSGVPSQEHQHSNGGPTTSGEYQIPPPDGVSSGSGTHDNRHQYLFVDNGNVFVGAQSMPDGSMDLAVRVNVKELAELVEQNQPCAMREVAASRPSNPRICAAWRKVNYVVHNDTPSSTARQTLCSRIFATLVDHRLEGRPQTLVIATGDGTQFPQLVEMALRKQWNVILWSWNRCLSEKFRKIQAEYPNLMTIRLFDEHRLTVTFRAPERRDRRPGGMQGGIQGAMPHHPQAVMAMAPRGPAAHVPLPMQAFAPAHMAFDYAPCFFCRERPSEFSLSSCNHVRLCRSCYSCASWRKCPVCQQDTALSHERP